MADEDVLRHRPPQSRESDRRYPSLCSDVGSLSATNSLLESRPPDDAFIFAAECRRSRSRLIARRGLIVLPGWHRWLPRTGEDFKCRHRARLPWSPAPAAVSAVRLHLRFWRKAIR